MRSNRNTVSFSCLPKNSIILAVLHPAIKDQMVLLTVQDSWKFLIKLACSGQEQPFEDSFQKR